MYSTDHVSFFSNIIFYVCNRGRGQSHPHPRKLYLPKLYFDTLQASKTSRHFRGISKTTHINHEPSRHTNRNPSEFKVSSGTKTRGGHFVQSNNDKVTWAPHFMTPRKVSHLRIQCKEKFLQRSTPSATVCIFRILDVMCDEAFVILQALLIWLSASLASIS